jgi:hypothetical protein
MMLASKHHKKYFFVATFVAIISAIIYYLWIANPLLIKGHIMLHQTQPWTLPQAYEFMSSRPSWGIIDPVKHEILKQRAATGDKNALFVYARALSFSPDFMMNNLENNNSDNKIIFKEYGSIMCKLAQQNHAPAARYIADSFYGHGFTGLMLHCGINPKDYFKESERLYRVAITGGERAHQELVVLLVYGEEVWEDRGSTRLLSPAKSNDLTKQKEVIQLLYPLINAGSTLALAQLTDANLHGIGVQQNYAEAYALALLGNDRAKSLYFDSDMQPDYFAKILKNISLSEQAIKTAQERYLRLKAVIPMEENFKKWQSEIH